MKVPKKRPKLDPPGGTTFDFKGSTFSRPGLAEPRSASLAGFGFFHQHIRKGKVVITKTSKEKRLLLGSFLAPETDMIFGDGVGASPVSATRRKATGANHKKVAAELPACSS